MNVESVITATAVSNARRGEQGVHGIGGQARGVMQVCRYMLNVSKALPRHRLARRLSRPAARQVASQRV